VSDEIQEQMKGTPAEEFEALANRLRQLKTTVGYSDLVKLVKDREANLLRAFLSTNDEDLVQLRADFRAWHNVIQIIDEPIVQYDVWLDQTLKQIQKQDEMIGAQRGR